MLSRFELVQQNDSVGLFRKLLNVFEHFFLDMRMTIVCKRDDKIVCGFIVRFVESRNCRRTDISIVGTKCSDYFHTDIRETMRRLSNSMAPIFNYATFKPVVCGIHSIFITAQSPHP